MVSKFNNNDDYKQLKNYNVNIFMLSLYLSRKYAVYSEIISWVDYYSWCLKHGIESIPCDVVGYLTVNYPERLV